jgi:uncharacterized secreted repeat protein (TIGR03808 family)
MFLLCSCQQKEHPMPFYKILDDVAIIDPGSTVPAGWISGALPAAISAARTNGRPLFLRPGTYDAANINILSTNDGGKPIRIFATPGTATIRFTGGTHCIQIKDVNEVQFDGIGFNFQNLALPAYSTPNGTGVNSAGYIVINNSAFFLLEDCTFADGNQTAAEQTSNQSNSYKALVLVTGISIGNITSCKFARGDVALWTQRSRVTATANIIDTMQSNAIMISDLANGGNHSLIENNYINNINAPYGNGQTGNGIAVYRANNVVCRNNTTLTCKYSGVRFNASSRAIISGNTIWNARETALWAEAPGVGQNMIGSIITDNSIDYCGSGIVVANSGLYPSAANPVDGISRQSIIRGNLVTNMLNNSIPAVPGAAASVTVGIGISVEQDCLVQSNIFENCPGAAIKLGVANAARDLVCDGNLVRNSPVGIVFSSDPAASNILITNNAIRGASTAQVASTPSNSFTPLTATYSANTLSQTAGTGGTVLIADNRSA